ncbi:hypothetical protein AAVH_23258 [Aphelenchoides avenae]|nr:hypothetical protein AAVH_23258 [Aphelenchus avenae]
MEVRLVLRALVPFYDEEVGALLDGGRTHRKSHGVAEPDDFRPFNRRNVAKDSRLFIAVVASERQGYYLTSVVAGLGQVYSVTAPSARAHVDESAHPSIAIRNTADGHFEELRLLETKLEVIEIDRDGRLSGADYDEWLRKEADDYWKCLNVAKVSVSTRRARQRSHPQRICFYSRFN